MIDLRQGDCIERMKEMEDNSVDLILTDPPYELNFMGKKWDNTGIAFNTDMWKEAMRILKPGGYLMAFSGTRTYHRMVVSIEEAGFEIKDMINWTYGSGFPKALDISKALDKKMGAEREVIGNYKQHNVKGTRYNTDAGKAEFISLDITAPSSEIAKQYEGYKSQLKPSHEPCVLAMKPLAEKNFAENVMKYGTGGLNIDGARIGTDDLSDDLFRKRNGGFNSKYVNGNNDYNGINNNTNIEGRYPANTIISEDIAPVLDEQSGSGASRFFYNAKIEEGEYTPFYYTAKCSKRERNSDINGEVHNSLNNHATVKCKAILTYLLKMGLPPYDSVVLDMFAGSGSLGLAIADVNKETGRQHKAILIEMDKDHCEIIKKRCCL